MFPRAFFSTSDVAYPPDVPRPIPARTNRVPLAVIPAEPPPEISSALLPWRRPSSPPSSPPPWCRREEAVRGAAGRPSSATAAVKEDPRALWPAGRVVRRRWRLLHLLLAPIHWPTPNVIIISGSRVGVQVCSACGCICLRDLQRSFTTVRYLGHGGQYSTAAFLHALCRPAALWRDCWPQATDRLKRTFSKPIRSRCPYPPVVWWNVLPRHLINCIFCLGLFTFMWVKWPTWWSFIYCRTNCLTVVPENIRLDCRSKSPICHVSLKAWEEK